MIVYLARNSKNGKAYVGKTERALEQRIKEHVRFAGKDSPQPFHRAIRKHGIEAFEWSVLVEGECTHEELDLLEQDFIERLGTFGSAGYNATRGGDGVRGHRHSPETRAKMSESRKGARNPNYGKKDWGFRGPFTDASKQKMREAAVGRKHSEETKYKIAIGSARPKVAIPVRQLDTEGNVVATYASMSQACMAIGARSYGIKSCCEGRRQSYAGHCWEYVKG